MPSRKQKVEKEIWQQAKPFLDLPPATDNMAEYMAARRKIAKASSNPVFIRDFKRLTDDIKKFLNKDMSEFFE